MTTRTRYGIQLYERICKQCKQGRFWVPKRSSQIFCGEQCQLDSTGAVRKFFKLKPGRRKKAPAQTEEELLDDEFD